MTTITMSQAQREATKVWEAAGRSAQEALEASAEAKRKHGKGSPEHKAALLLVDSTGDALDAAAEAMSATAGQETRSET